MQNWNVDFGDNNIHINKTYEQNWSQTMNFFLIPHFKQNWRGIYKILLSIDNDHLNDCYVFNIQGFFSLCVYVCVACAICYFVKKHILSELILVFFFFCLKRAHRTSRFIQIDKQVRVCMCFVRKKTVWTYYFIMTF